MSSTVERKYNVLKRKCDSLEEANQSLYWKLKNINKMITEEENEKKFLETKLHCYELETPPTLTPNTDSTTAVSPSQGNTPAPPPPPPLLHVPLD